MENGISIEAQHVWYNTGNASLRGYAIVHNLTGDMYWDELIHKTYEDAVESLIRTGEYWDTTQGENRQGKTPWEDDYKIVALLACW